MESHELIVTNNAANLNVSIYTSGHVQRY